MAKPPDPVTLELYKAFGSASALAKALPDPFREHVPISTVLSWQKNGVPVWRIPAIKAAAKAKKVRLPKEFEGRA